MRSQETYRLSTHQSSYPVLQPRSTGIACPLPQGLTKRCVSIRRLGWGAKDRRTLPVRKLMLTIMVLLGSSLTASGPIWATESSPTQVRHIVPDLQKLSTPRHHNRNITTRSASLLGTIAPRAGRSRLELHSVACNAAAKAQCEAETQACEDRCIASGEDSAVCGNVCSDKEDTCKRAAGCS